MARFKISLNMEFCRSADKWFDAGVRIAPELGYRLVEPMVHNGLAKIAAAWKSHDPFTTTNPSNTAKP